MIHTCQTSCLQLHVETVTSNIISIYFFFYLFCRCPFGATRLQIEKKHRLFDGLFFPFIMRSVSIIFCGLVLNTSLSFFYM